MMHHHCTISSHVLGANHHMLGQFWVATFNGLECNGVAILHFPVACLEEFQVASSTEYGVWDLVRHFVNNNLDVIQHSYQDMIARQWVFSSQCIMTASLKQELIGSDNVEIMDWLCSQFRHHD